MSKHISEVPHQITIVYEDSDFDDFIESWTGKKWSIQQSMLDCDNMAGQGVVNVFEADFWPDSEYWIEDVRKVEEWLTKPSSEPYHFEGRWEHEGVSTDMIFSWLCARGALPVGEYSVVNRW